MADISITAANVIPSAAAIVKKGTAGATIAQGDLLYIDTAANDVLKLCDADASAIASTVAGIASAGASAGQIAYYVVKDPSLALGGTVALGDRIYASATAGKITKTEADLVSGMYITCLGVCNDAGNKVNFNITRGGLKA